MATELSQARKTTNVQNNLKGSAKKEAFHREAEGRMKPFKFTQPDDLPDDRKVICNLAKSDILEASVQIIPEGGDTNLHYHPRADGFWMSLKGHVRFYGPDGVVGEFGPNEGMFVPRNARYWFETADPKQELHLLHISSHLVPQPKNRRVNVDAPSEGYMKTVQYNPND